jgi:hypothetical protein
MLLLRKEEIKGLPLRWKEVHIMLIACCRNIGKTVFSNPSAENINGIRSHCLAFCLGAVHLKTHTHRTIIEWVLKEGNRYQKKFINLCSHPFQILFNFTSNRKTFLPFYKHLNSSGAWLGPSST